MKIIHFEEQEPKVFNGDTVNNVTGRVVIGRNDGAQNFCMRTFTLSPGGFTPKHTHEWEHEIFIHSGKGKIFVEGKYQDVSAGTVIFIPGMEEHQFKNDSENDLIFVCLIPSGVPEL